MAAKSAIPWTLGRVKSAGLSLVARCQNDRCGRTYEASLEGLIAHFGAYAPLTELAGQTCEACSAALGFSLVVQDDGDDDWDMPDEAADRDWRGR
jgi:hypothetical protein